MEKTEVCSGEDNLVTVRLAGDHQTDKNIRITMPGLGGAGRQMPFILGLTAAKQQPEMPEVLVSGRDGALATVKVPTVTVKDCIPGPSLSVEVALVANTSATFALTATVRTLAPRPSSRFSGTGTSVTAATPRPRFEPSSTATKTARKGRGFRASSSMSVLPTRKESSCSAATLSTSSGREMSSSSTPSSALAFQ